MRIYTRYHSDIPIEFDLGNITTIKGNYINNFSKGGLSFHSMIKVRKETKIMIQLPIIHQAFKVKCNVVWCRRKDDGYNIGVQFTDSNNRLQITMIEQICCIEHYKNEVLKKEGRQLTSQEAALEWIKNYAGDFRKLKDSQMRRYTRYFSDVPIEFDIVEALMHKNTTLQDISEGGLSFKYYECLEKDTLIRIQIPLINPLFKINAKVVSCHQEKDLFAIGVEFIEQSEEFQGLILNQIRYIENFRHEVLVKEGRSLSCNEAYKEILKKHTKDMPGFE